jgi:hypothetical protein
MLNVSRWLLVIAGVLLIRDAIFLLLGLPNFFGLPFPCPIMLLALGIGLLLLTISSKAFTKH